MAGARAVLPSNGAFSVQSFWRDVSAHGVTQVILVPTMLSLLLADAEVSSSSIQPSSLRFFRSVGAALPEATRRGIRQKFGLEVHEVGPSPIKLAHNAASHFCIGFLLPWYMPKANEQAADHLNEADTHFVPSVRIKSLDSNFVRQKFFWQWHPAQANYYYTLSCSTLRMATRRR